VRGGTAPNSSQARRIARPAQPAALLLAAHHARLLGGALLGLPLSLENRVTVPAIGGTTTASLAFPTRSASTARLGALPGAQTKGEGYFLV